MANPSLPGVPVFNLEIDHFRVLRVLGQGGMGRVLLARDKRLGRLAALKILRPDRMDPDRVLALIDEAKLTARLSHPHIIVIYHVGRAADAPYLAFEYLDGQTLRARMRDGGLAAREVVRYGVAIASALTAAHAAGIVHRDLKPENVMLPRDGRLRVVDFGIASVMETLPGGPRRARDGQVIGTPAYMAPEQWTGAQAESAVDIWSLGVVLYELLSGHRPFEGPRADSRPLQLRILDEALAPPPLHVELQGLGDLVAAMLTRAPAHRPSAAQVLDRLESLLQQGTAMARAGGPFRGLLAFEEADAAWFFGRDAEVDALVERVREATVVPVVGPSGAGKSSLVRAGLLPRLREQGAWTVLTLRPGGHPLEALAARLIGHDTSGRSALTTTSGRSEALALAAEIRADPRVCNVRLHAIAEQRATRMILIIDQLEEVATHAIDPVERDAFLDAIAGAADPVDDLVRVVFTLRDDFLGRVATREPLRQTLRDVFVLRRLDALALRDAICLPLARAGHRFDDPTLPDAMVADVEGEPAALPLVQFACSALWERRDRDGQVLRRADYDALGGVAGALGRNAEAVLAGMTADAVTTARRLLMQLVGPEGARRVVSRAAALASAGDGAESVLERLTAARLVTSRRDMAENAASIVLELAHESLTRTWPQLQRWLDDSGDERAALQELEVASQLWERRGRREQDLWSDGDVRDAHRRLRSVSQPLAEPAASFLTAAETVAARARRRRVAAWTSVGAGLVAIAAGSLALAAMFADQEQQARTLASSLEQRNREIAAQNVEIQSAAKEMASAAADLGVVSLALGFFDWSADGRTPVPAPAMDQVAVEVWDVDPDYPFHAHQRRDGRWVRVKNLRRDGGKLTFDLETRSGPAVLRLRRAGCSAVDIPLRRLPGYSDRRDRETSGVPVEVWELPVPTCAATLADTLEVPAGPYVEGGVGVPEMRGPLRTRPESTVDLPRFRIDRTEVRNAQHATFGALQGRTGVPSPDYPDEGATPNARSLDHPATGMDAYAAEAYCRWLGRRLPSSAEWTKAGRGGIRLADGAQNPSPRRNLPWAGTDASASGQRGKANLLDTDEDWSRTTSPVDALPDGASPYGVLGMGGNVSEWTSTSPPSGGPNSGRVIRDADYMTPAKVNVGSLAVINQRSPRYASFSLGVRCAVDVGE